MARVLIPTPLRPYTGQQGEVEADGRTVGDVLSSLTTRYGDLRRISMRTMASCEAS
jgi:molybdopterin converting factor small subunit